MKHVQSHVSRKERSIGHQRPDYAFPYKPSLRLTVQPFYHFVALSEPSLQTHAPIVLYSRGKTATVSKTILIS